jgi:hypothetical protein
MPDLLYRPNALLMIFARLFLHSDNRLYALNKLVAVARIFMKFGIDVML